MVVESFRPEQIAAEYAKLYADTIVGRFTPDCDEPDAYRRLRKWLKRSNVVQTHDLIFVNTSTAIPDRQKSDWLRYFIKRLPPDEALLKALEYRYFNLLDLPQPCLDLRDDGIQSFAAMTDLAPNSYAAIILSANKQSQSLAEKNCVHSIAACSRRLLALTVGRTNFRPKAH